MPGRRDGWADHARKAAERAVAKRQAEHDELVVPRIRELRAEGCGWKTVAEVLDLDGVPAPRGGAWSATAVRRIAKRHGLVVRPGEIELRISQAQAWAIGDLIAEAMDMANPPTAAVHHGDRLLAVRAIVRRALVAEARH